MTVPRVLEMGEYWRMHPPLQELFAAFVGYKATPARMTEQQQADNSDALLRDLMAAGVAMPPDLITG